MTYCKLLPTLDHYWSPLHLDERETGYGEG
jgi:hypothetical protein